MPSLADVQQDSTILASLPRALIAELRRQIRHLAADVDATWYQTLTEARTPDPSSAEPDRLLRPEAAAARFGVTKGIRGRARGGRARMGTLSPEERVALSRKAALARWCSKV